jgi:hypothetical protein
MLKSLKLAFLALVVAVLSACATAPGAKFTELAPVAPEMADVYVYRTSGVYASAQAFEVTLDGKAAGQLFNASYLHLRLPPGNHVLKVAPGGFGKISELQFQAEAGKQTFMQYDFVGGLLGNAFFIGSSIKPRDSLVAVAELKELKSAK